MKCVLALLILFVGVVVIPSSMGQDAADAKPSGKPDVKPDADLAAAEPEQDAAGKSIDEACFKFTWTTTNTKGDLISAARKPAPCTGGQLCGVMKANTDTPEYGCVPHGTVPCKVENLVLKKDTDATCSIDIANGLPVPNTGGTDGGVTDGGVTEGKGGVTEGKGGVTEGKGGGETSPGGSGSLAGGWKLTLGGAALSFAGVFYVL